MKQKNTVIFTTIISTIFVLTIAVYICSLSIEYNKGKVASQERFTNLTRDVATGIRANNPGTQQFIDAIVDSIGSVSDLAFIQVKSGSTVYFSYPANVTDSSSVTSPFVRAFTTTISSGDGSLCNMTAALYLLKPSSIFYKGRIAFIIILAATIAAIIYLVFISKKESSVDETSDETDAIISSAEPLDSAGNEETDSFSAFEPEPILSTKLHVDHDSPLESDLNDDSDNTVPEDISEEQFEEPVKHTIDTNKVDATIPKSTDSNPNGLFSPVTGFGWESYMTTRLDSELSRAASSEQDLALFTIRIPCLDSSCDAAKEIYSLIIDTFKFKDLVFEYKEDGCSAIMQNVNIDQALVIADNLHIAITSILAKAGLDAVPAIGISSRSLRLISGERLASESEQALIHAFEDKESPVIAFRVNPDKYRNYLASEAATLPPEV